MLGAQVHSALTSYHIYGKTPGSTWNAPSVWEPLTAALAASWQGGGIHLLGLHLHGFEDDEVSLGFGVRLA